MDPAFGFSATILKTDEGKIAEEGINRKQQREIRIISKKQIKLKKQEPQQDGKQDFE